MGEQVVSHPGSKIELLLASGVWVGRPKGVNVGELTLLLICHGVAQMQR